VSDYTPPEGYHTEWVEEDHWRLVHRGEEDRRCRWGAGYHHKACGKPAVAALDRGHGSGNWWFYCADHLYGRRIVDGEIQGRRFVKDEG
jgi:hypothetical protein